MVPLNLLWKLAPRAHLSTIPSRTLRTSEGWLKQCGGGGEKRRDADDVCQQSKPCKSGKMKKVKYCSKMQETESNESKAEGVPDSCSRQALLDCAKKLEDLQKQWEAMARAAERLEAASQRVEGIKRASGCPVKPPPKPEKEGSSMPIVLSLLVVIAGVAYYLYTQSQEGEGGDGEGKEKDEKK